MTSYELACIEMAKAHAAFDIEFAETEAKIKAIRASMEADIASNEAYVGTHRGPNMAQQMCRQANHQHMADSLQFQQQHIATVLMHNNF